MINWLIQSNSAHPDLDRGIAPAVLLSAEEAARFASLRNEKRRREWLLGRWTAKHLLQIVIRNAWEELLPLNELSIYNLPNGAPCFNSKIPVSLSISHRDNYAFCAAIDRPYWPLGADLERVESRAATFEQEYFTKIERTQINQSPAEKQSLLVTAIWSIKEAALKALKLGLVVDTRSVSCVLGPHANIQGSWSSVDISLDPHRLSPIFRSKKRSPAASHELPLLTGWWRAWDDYVLALVSSII